MRRIFSILIVSALVICASVPALADYSSVSVRNSVASSKPVSYTYDSDNSEEIIQSIKTLMTKLGDLTRKNDVVQTLTVTSDSADKASVDIKLRLSIPETVTKSGTVKTPTSDEYAALDYYRIKVTASDGKVIFEDGDTQYKNAGSSYRDIPLGTFNETEGSESRVYNIALSVNSATTSTAVTSNAKKLDWSIVSQANPSEKTAESTPTPSEDDNNTGTAATATPAASVPPATPAVTPSAKTDKNGTVTLSAGEYTVGEDIDAGRYTVTGDGKISVYNADNTPKMTVALKGASSSSSNGVSEYVVNLADGERIAADSDIKLVPYTAASPTPKPTSTPKASSSSSSSSNSSSSGSSKTNPKTGDSAPVGIVSAVGVLALAGTILTVKKNKKNR